MSKLRILYGNILDIKEGIICQQVNCMGVMGSGLAKQIRNKYPRVYQKYKDFLNDKSLKIIPIGKNIRGLKVVEETSEDFIGKVLMVDIKDNLYIANLFAQHKYGRDKQYTEYDKFEESLENLKFSITDTNLENLPIYFPYKIGCGLGGGDWNIISSLIEKVFPNAIIVKLEEE